MTNEFRPVHILGVPLDLGQTVRGTDVGPSALRYANLEARIAALGFTVTDLGNLNIPSPNSVPKDQVTGAIADACRLLRDTAERSLLEGAIFITLGGDHSVAIGSVAGARRAAPTGLLWVDAHGDFNTPETSLTGNVHGMPLAVLLGRGHEKFLKVLGEARVDPAHVALVGIRDLDAREREALRNAGVRVFTMREVDERGMGTVAAEAIARVKGPGRVHLSLDIDALDPGDAPGVATPVRGGLSYREAHLLMEVLADEKLLRSLDVVEVNPMLDVKNRTAETAVDLVVSALGARIL
jgi:arginase